MKKFINRLIALSSACILIGSTLSCSKTNEQMNKSENAVIECIMTRKSVRQFTPQEVPDEKIQTILKAGMAAPSAMNKQPWKFVVLKDKQILKSLADSLPNSRTATASTAIIVCGDLSKTLEGRAQEFWVQDCSAASQNILLAAHSLGLGAVWTGIYPDVPKAKYVAHLLGIDRRHIPLCIIPVGYPAEVPEPKNKWNPENVIYK